MLIKRLLIALFLLFPAKGFAADSTVAALAAASALAGSELFYCVQSSADKKCTASQLSTFILTAPNIGVATATSVNGVGLTGSGTITATASTSIGAGQYLGTAGNTAASAGNIGELISSTIASGSAVSLSNNAPANLTSISVTAGTWDIRCNLIYVDTATTVVSYLLGSISTTTGTVSVSPGQYTTVPISTAGAANANITTIGMWVGPLDAPLSGTTTYFCVAQGGFSVSTLTVYGVLSARRVH